MDRFKKVYRQGTLAIIKIWVDTETGVNCRFHRNGVKNERYCKCR